MRIRAWVVTGVAACVALSAVVMIVLTSDPATAERPLYILFGAGVVVALWAGVATVLLVCRASLVRAVWSPLPLLVAGGALWRVARTHVVSGRLLLLVLLGTLALTAFLWRVLVPPARNGST